MFTKKMDFSKMYYKKYDPETDWFNFDDDDDVDQETGSYFHMDLTTGRFQLNKYSRYFSKIALRFNLVELFDNYF